MTDAVHCRECGNRYPDMHHLVDHISDDHDLFSWVAEGRPVDRPGGRKIEGNA